jgi:hypothetical protein
MLIGFDMILGFDLGGYSSVPTGDNADNGGGS